MSTRRRIRRSGRPATPDRAGAAGPGFRRPDGRERRPHAAGPLTDLALTLERRGVKPSVVQEVRELSGRLADDGQDH